MELFKNLIRYAIAAKARQVALNEGAAPLFLTEHGMMSPPDAPRLTREYLLHLSGMLFPRQLELASGKPFLQPLNVGGTAPLQIVVSGNHPATIKIFFPPDGEMAAQEELMQLLEESAFAESSPSAPSDEAPDPFAESMPSPNSVPTSAQRTPEPVAALPEPTPRSHAVAPDTHEASSETEIFFGPAPGERTQKRMGGCPIDRLLEEMIRRKASDVHLTMSEPIVMRIDGDIERIGHEPLTEETMREYLLPIMPRLNQEEFARDNDTDFAYEVPNVGRFRVNMFRDRNGVGAVLRHIPAKILTAEQLNLPKAVLDFCTLTKGLVLVTGPTGSGKSTTLAAMIDLINKARREHILTIEDPIEFVHPQYKCLVNQREISRHTSTFSRALRAALREDPDIVLIGEMRDLETVAIAIETAETGHLVFGTLHTNTAISTVDRIIDQFPADRQAQIRTMLASSLKGVVSQTLLKKKGGGRVAALEILVPDDACASMIREGKIHMLSNHMQTQKSRGNQLLNEALLHWVREGVVDFADAFAKAVDKKGIIGSAKSMGIKVEGYDVERGTAPAAAPASTSPSGASMPPRKTA